MWYDMRKLNDDCAVLCDAAVLRNVTVFILCVCAYVCVCVQEVASNVT